MQQRCSSPRRHGLDVQMFPCGVFLVLLAHCFGGVCRESSSQTESLLDEVLGEMLTKLCSAEVALERERLAEERRVLEEARRVCTAV